jgi:hypothetical protein
MEETMTSEPTPTQTLTATTGGEDLIISVPPSQSAPVFSGPLFGGAAPSAPTTDAPTDALAAIRARHERDERLTRWVRPDEMHADRAALLAEVERLNRQAESWATVVRQSQDGWDEALRERDALAARLRGGATAPTPDPTTAEDTR